MSDELDIFAGAITKGSSSKPAQQQPKPQNQQPQTQAPQSQAPQSQPQAQPSQLPQQSQQNGGGQGMKKRDKFRNRGGRNFTRGNKPNNSPIRGANGEESVNPLLNAPLPTDQKELEPETPANPNRNPDLPEYRLADIQTWPAPQIVERMMPGADPEELGSYRKHELIFAAIRRYLANGGAVLASGCLEIVREGHGFLRSAKNNFLACPEDVFVTQQQIRRHALRTGDIVEGPIRDPRDRDRFFCLGNVATVNGKEPSVAARVIHFENLTATFPTRRIILETDPKEFSTRVVDLFTPIGFGQRGLIIAPPRVGKTVLLQKMANAISKNYPEAMLIILLIDERPEEVTDMQRNTKAMVLSSTFDEEPQHHVNVTEMVLEMSKRQVENGRDVIILMDSLTRMARAYNTVQPHSGKILTGGVDALAMHRPKRFFGAARNIEEGGSLTMIATVLVETGSRMDDVIFEEFKGTGNSEIRLDRSLSEARIFPAIDLTRSGTRHEELLLTPAEREGVGAVRSMLAQGHTREATAQLLSILEKTKSNKEFFRKLQEWLAIYEKEGYTIRSLRSSV